MRSIHLSLRAGERIFINGAVLRVDRKVSLELLNEATFLLEHHVLQVEDATTPLRQLYFVVQSILIEPERAETALGLFRGLHEGMTKSFENAEILGGLQKVAELVEGGKAFEALRALRALQPIEDEILKTKSSALQPTQAA